MIFHYIRILNLCLQKLAVSDIKENGTFPALPPILLLERVPLKLNLITLQIFIFRNCFQAESVLTIQMGLSFLLFGLEIQKAPPFPDVLFYVPEPLTLSPLNLLGSQNRVFGPCHALVLL